MRQKPRRLKDDGSNCKNEMVLKRQCRTIASISVVKDSDRLTNYKSRFRNSHLSRNHLTPPPIYTHTPHLLSPRLLYQTLKRNSKNS